MTDFPFSPINASFMIMKILYIITKSNWGGAQRHVFDLSTAMKEKGHDVWVALGGEGLLKKKLEEAGIYTFPINTLGRDVSLNRDTASFREIYSIIKNKRPDIVHLHSPKAAGLGSLAGRLLRVKKIVTTVHGWTFNEVRPLYERISIAFFSWLTAIFSHITILISEKDYNQALYFPFVKKKIRHIPLGLKPCVFLSIDGAKHSIAKSIGMDLVEFNRKIAIACITELHPNKGLKYLIEAMENVFQSHPEAILAIIGDGQDREILTKQIAEKKLEKQIFLVGYLDNANQYLKAFTFLTLPSLKEGLPYAILEAGSASLPVVATTVGGIPEIVEDMKSGILIQSKNTRELAHALSFMIEHPEERKRYGQALKERVATKFALDKMIWMIENLYLETTAAQ